MQLPFFFFFFTSVEIYNRVALLVMISFLLAGRLFKVYKKRKKKEEVFRRRFLGHFLMTNVKLCLAEVCIDLLTITVIVVIIIISGSITITITNTTNIISSSSIVIVWLLETVTPISPRV